MGGGRVRWLGPGNWTNVEKWKQGYYSIVKWTLGDGSKRIWARGVKSGSCEREGRGIERGVNTKAGSGSALSRDLLGEIEES
jgi:hypothetical protein